MCYVEIFEQKMDGWMDGWMDERASKVVDFGTNQKHGCNFLLVLTDSSNIRPILPRFKDIAGCRYS